VKIKCTCIKYDQEGLDPVEGLPKSAVVEVSDDLLECCVGQEEGSRDEAEAREMVEEALEEKAGAPVASFKANGKEAAA